MNVTIVFIVLYNVLCSLESRSDGYDRIDVLNNDDFIVTRAKIPDVRGKRLKSSNYIVNRDSETSYGTHLNGNALRTRRSSHNQENMYNLPKALSHNHEIFITGEKKDNNSIGVIFSNGIEDIKIILEIPETKFTLRFLILRHEIDEHRIQVFYQESHQTHVAVENISDLKFLMVSDNIDVESLTFTFKH